MRIEDLTDKAVGKHLKLLLLSLMEDEELDVDAQRDLLEALILTMDDLDCNDTFGTEGWRHTYGFAD